MLISNNNRNYNLHAELVETNKRRKANIASLKTVKFILFILKKKIKIYFINSNKLIIKYIL